MEILVEGGRESLMEGLLFLGGMDLNFKLV